MRNTDWKDETVQELKKGYMAMITDRDERIDILTAHNESMQADAVNNTATINMLMAQLAERNKEVSQLKEKVRYAYVQIEALEAK